MRVDHAHRHGRPTSLPAARALCLALLAAAMAGGAGRVHAAAQPPSLRRPDQVKELAAGKVLVSARGLPDPNFAETVILLLEYDGDHALGLIVNRPTEVPLSRVFPQLMQPRGQTPRVYFGGPVQVEGALALARAARAPADAHRVFGDVYLINSRERLEAAVKADSGSTRLRVYLGYAGWGRGQLEMETSQGAWHVFPADAGSVYDPEPESLWPRQIHRAEERVLLASDVASNPVLTPGR